jgi:hypothetical protein
MKNKYLILVLTILIAAILPFILLSLYDHPSADDYGFTHIVKYFGFFEFQKFIYMYHQGRFSSNFIFSINPLVYDSFTFYKVLPVILLMLFFIAVFIFIRALFRNFLSIFQSIVASLFFSALYLNIIPNPSETIYWMTGSLIYFLPCILLLLFLSLIVKLLSANSISITIIACIIAPVLQGFNEVIMLYAIAIVFFIFQFQIKNKSLKIKLAWVLIILVVSAIIEIIAPGNYERMTIYGNAENIHYSVITSLISFAKLLLIHFSNPSFLIISLLSILFFQKIKNKSVCQYSVCVNPWTILVFIILIFIAVFFPVAYGTGYKPPLRIYNTLSLPFMITWFYFLFIFVGRYNFNLAVSIKRQTVLFIVAAILLFFNISKDPGKSDIAIGNIFTAWNDLFFKARSYDKQLNMRYEQIALAKNSSNTNVVVDSLNCIPRTLYFIDIGKDSSSWVNMGTAQYFGISSIRTK